MEGGLLYWGLYSLKGVILFNQENLFIGDSQKICKTMLGQQASLSIGAPWIGVIYQGHWKECDTLIEDRV